MIQRTGMAVRPETELKQQAGPRENVLEAIRRKDRSEKILLSEGLAVNPDLPLIESSDNVFARQKEEIVLRALCLLIVAIKAERMDQSMVLRVVRQYGLAAHFSPVEKEFIRNPVPDVRERDRFACRYESAWVLLWALRYVRNLGIPNSACDVGFAVGCMRDRNTRAFIAGARLRPLEEILDQADLIYRYHWLLADAALANRSLPAKLDPSIVYERHYACNWLIRHDGDHDWDEVTPTI